MAGLTVESFVETCLKTILKTIYPFPVTLQSSTRLLWCNGNNINATVNYETTHNALIGRHQALHNVHYMTLLAYSDPYLHKASKGR